MGEGIKLSAVIITFNEERNIQRCLDSLKGIADEIIVVDSFSTDHTERICELYDVKFVKQAWLGYSGQKNFANALTTGDFVLSVDADEVISEELASSIKEIKKNPNNDVYVVKRLTNYCGKWIRHCGWYPDKKIRIWRKGKAEWQGEIHEIVKFHDSLSPLELKGDLLHYSYYSIKGHLNQINLFTEIMAEEAVKKGKRSSIFHILFSPVLSFLKGYFLQLGFLDGYYGFVVCSISAQASFYKYLKIHELLKKHEA